MSCKHNSSLYDTDETVQVAVYNLKRCIKKDNPCPNFFKRDCYI